MADSSKRRLRHPNAGGQLHQDDRVGASKSQADSTDDQLDTYIVNPTDHRNEFGDEQAPQGKQYKH